MLRTRQIKIEELPADLEGGAELAELGQEATEFLLWHHWCRSVRQGYLDCGWPGILAVFYFEIEPASDAADARLWVIVGDLPPAYLDVVSCPDAASALDGYVSAMQEWIDCVSAEGPTDELIPVYRRGSLQRVDPTGDSTQMLQNRLNFIRTKIIPTIS